MHMHVHAECFNILYVFFGISQNFGFLTVFLESCSYIFNIKKQKFWKSNIAIFWNMLLGVFGAFICNFLLNLVNFNEF